MDTTHWISFVVAETFCNCKSVLDVTFMQKGII